MKRNVVTVFHILLVVIFLGSCLWFYNEPDYEPGLAIFGSLATLLSDLSSKLENKKKKDVRMMQKGGSNSKNYQASGNMTINNEK